VSYYKIISLTIEERFTSAGLKMKALLQSAQNLPFILQSKNKSIKAVSSKQGGF